MRRLLVACLFLAACGGGEDDGGPAGDIGRFGPTCGSSSIIGVPEARITSGISRKCGIRYPVRVHEIAGVKLSQKPLMNCKAARAFETWVRRSAKREIADMGDRLESIRVAAHYTCRTRNNQPGAKVSEHGKGAAIDISGFNLASGDTISVLRDWGNGEKGRALANMRRRACGPFGVVLGPGSDRFHNDHFHFDVSNLSSRYCR